VLVWLELVDEELEELCVLDPVEEPVCELCVLDELELEEELETLGASVVVEVAVSVPVASARFGELPELERSAPPAGANWPPSPMAVSPPPASAESAARRAQRRWMLIGGLQGRCS
jgi:hypothetical protein